MKKTLAALAGALVALPVLAAGPQGFAAAPQAQGPKGFDTEPATTVAAVLESGKDHQIVTLRGKFTEHVRGDKYVLHRRQGCLHQGRARHDRDWSMITKDAPVEIRAEVDNELDRNRLDVLSAKRSEASPP